MPRQQAYSHGVDSLRRGRGLLVLPTRIERVTDAVLEEKGAISELHKTVSTVSVASAPLSNVMTLVLAKERPVGVGAQGQDDIRQFGCGQPEKPGNRGGAVRAAGHGSGSHFLECSSARDLQVRRCGVWENTTVESAGGFGHGCVDGSFFVSVCFCFPCNICGHSWIDGQASWYRSPVTGRVMSPRLRYVMQPST